LLLTSTETIKILAISSCELMHKRSAGELKFIKKGNSYFYEINDNQLLLKLPLAQQLINWYQKKHPLDIHNHPESDESLSSIIMMTEKILMPILKSLGEIEISYGFTSTELTKYIQKNSSQGTYPPIDQHSSYEKNSAGGQICKRGGMACDFIVKGQQDNVPQIIQFIVSNLDYDKIYYYGNNRPLHVSVNSKPEKHLQIMNLSENGKRIPGRKAYAEKAIILASEL
jgi:hypothetical protein